MTNLKRPVNNGRCPLCNWSVMVCSDGDETVTYWRPNRSKCNWRGVSIKHCGCDDDDTECKHPSYQWR